jgi:hypothetical protein
MHQPHRREQNGQDPLIVIVLAVCFLLVLPCVLIVLLTRRLPRHLIERQVFWPLVAIVGTVCVAFFLLIAYPFRSIHDQLISLLIEVIREARQGSWSILRLLVDLRPIWLESLLMAPGVAFLVHLFTPQNAELRLLASRQQRAADIRAASKRVERRMTIKRLPERVREHMVLGLPVHGDLREWITRGLFILPIQELGKHGIVLGTSGTGKSETLLRLAVGAACVCGWQVIYIDGKGDRDAGVRFVAAMKAARLQRVKMFPAEPYAGWIGGEEALLSRLLAVEEYSDTHYRAVAENLLRLTISVPEKPVRNSVELLVRLNLTNGVLLGLYKGCPEQEAYLMYLSKRDPLGVYNRYAALLGKLHGRLDGSWSFDTVDAAYVCLDGLALSGIISGLGRYFVEDFSHYAGCRKPRDRRVLFIFDELSAVEVNLANLCERVRARGVSVFASGQSDSSIAYRGFTQNADRLLSAATTIILHACNDPNSIIARAGTQHTVEEAAGVAGDEVTGHSTMRIAESSKVDPNIVRQLSTGEICVIAHGKAHLVRVMPVNVDKAALAEAEAYVHPANQPSKDEPSSSSTPSAPIPETPVPVTTNQEASTPTLPLTTERATEDKQDKDYLA